MAKVALLQVGPLSERDESGLAEKFDVFRYFEAEDPTAYLAEHGAKIRAVATAGDRGANAALIEALPNVEIISVFGVGFDAVDIDLCSKKGIRVTNTPGVLTEDVADLAVALMLCQAREMVPAEAWARSGNWGKNGSFPLVRRAHGKKAGILGLGAIGMAVGRRLAAFGMDIAYSSRSAKDEADGWTFIEDPVALADHADFFFVTLASNAETKQIVSKSVIEALGPTGTLINVARGAVVDEAAMLDALEDGRLGFAALDVFEGEPAIDPRFQKLDNVLLSPHHGSATTETRQAMGELMRANLEAYFDGRDLLTPVV